MSDTLDFPGGLSVTTNGNIAQLRIPLPREWFVLPGDNWSAAMGHWSGAMLVFKQANGHWKLDTDRTFNVVFTNNDKPDIAINAKLNRAAGEALDAIASDIESGNIPTRQQAISEIMARIRRALMNVQKTDGGIMILPLIGG
jgi:hypothetical protein